MKRIAVIGDFMLDKYNYGKINGKCPEAPIQIFEKESTEYRLGGAGKLLLSLSTPKSHCQ